MFMLIGVTVIHAQSDGWVVEDIILKLEDGTTYHWVRDSRYNTSDLKEAVQMGDLVVAYGDYVDVLSSVYNRSLTMKGETDNATNVVANGIWVRDSVEHSIIVKDYLTTSETFRAVDDWIADIYFNYYDSPSDLYTFTEVEFHKPYGVLMTKTELLKVNDTSSGYDWYDVTVTQSLTPGANTSDSDWEWDWITYTMNGSNPGSNVFLSDYDSPPNDELPTGLFSFLWRILNFHPRDVFPWLYPAEPQVEGLDMSDFSQEKYMVRYQAPGSYPQSDEPLEVRHHFVLRVQDGVKPRFWQQSQVKYVRGSVLASPPYYSQLFHEGFLELR